MKKTALILFMIICLKANAQHFGVKTDLGASWQTQPPNPFGKVEITPSLYYSFGGFYSKVSSSSKWGFNFCLDYNKRGFRTFFITDPDESLYYHGSFSDSHSKMSNHSLALTLTPTINIANNFQIFLGPHITYALRINQSGTTNYYKDSQRTQLISSSNYNESNQGTFFSDRLSYGVKLGFNIKTSKKIDLGLSYQYSRRLKYPKGYTVPFYNIISLTTAFYLKARD
jgi:long-subunit fatty acid transport protein